MGIFAEVENGAGAARIKTKDSHFDKVGSIRRNWYIPDGTVVQVLCQEERVTLQRRTGLFMSRKYTVCWTNLYRIKRNGQLVSLVKFGEKSIKNKWRIFQSSWWKKHLSWSVLG